MNSLVGTLLRECQLVLLDWSGVISDDRLPVYEANMRMLDVRSIARISFEEWLPTTNIGLREALAEQGIEEEPGALFLEYTSLLARLKSQGLHPIVYPDAVAFVRSLNRLAVPTAVISSHPQGHLRQEAHQYEIARHVSQFVGSVTNKAASITEVVQTSSVAPNRVVYVGDTVFDIRAARTSGVLAVGITTGYHTRERLVAEEPDLVVDSLTELLESF